MSLKVLSLAIGAIWGLLAWMCLRAAYPENAWMAIPAGIGFTLLLYALLKIILHFEDKRYAQVEAGFSETPRFACEGVVYLGREVRGVRIYLFESSIKLVSMDKKPGLDFTMPFSCIQKVQREETRSLMILHMYGADENMELHFASRDAMKVADMIDTAMRESNDFGLGEKDTEDHD